jgi:hypothetical protein
LGELYHEGRYIDRPKEQWCFANARYAPAVYELDKAGEKVLAQLHPSMKSAKGNGDAGVQRHFAHALMIAETLASIELATRATERVRFIGSDKILEKAPEIAWTSRPPLSLPVTVTHSFKRTGKSETAKFSLVPDGLFGLEYEGRDGKSYRFFALELERENRVAASSLKPSSFLKKALAYGEVVARKIYSTQLGLPNLMVLVVTGSSVRVETMREVLLDLTAGKGSPIILFRALPGLDHPMHPASPAPEFLTGAWLRAGHSEFCIGRP